VVSYEALASSPEDTVRALCDAVGLVWEASMLEPASARPEFVTEDEVWKAPVEAPIAPAPSKFRRIFDEATQDWIERRLDRRFYREVRGRTAGEARGVWVSEGVG
jgi:hypothetical protein